MNVPVLVASTSPLALRISAARKCSRPLTPTSHPSVIKRRGERYGPDVVDLHGSGDGDDAAQFADLPHGFVEDGGDDASVGSATAGPRSARQLEIADESLMVLVEVKLQVQSAFVGGTATEAVVAVNALLDFVSGDGLVAGHVTKMNDGAASMQVHRELAR